MGNLDKSVIGRNAKKPKSNPELNANQKLIKTNILRVGQATLKLMHTRLHKFYHPISKALQ